MTTASHELALCIINDSGEGPGPHYGSTCKERCELASRRASAYVSYAAPREWVAITTLGAQAYHAEFGDVRGGAAHWSDIFDAEDILACAAELAGHYREHVKEVEAA